MDLLSKPAVSTYSVVDLVEWEMYLDLGKKKCNAL